MNNGPRTGTMKPNQRRPRSRGNGKRHSGRTYSFESNGPEGKIRGTAQQVFDKYQALARDSFSSGDRIAAEGYFQFAEHYFRILAADARTNGAARTEGEQGQNSGQDAANVATVPIINSNEDVPEPDLAQA